MILYYNNEGWVCNVYPSDIEKTDECQSIEVDDDYFSMHSCRVAYAWKVVDGQLTTERWREDNADEQMSELKNWFKGTYRYKFEKYNRLKTLGLTDDDGSDPDEELIELYKLAEEKRKSIQKLEGKASK